MFAETVEYLYPHPTDHTAWAGLDQADTGSEHRDWLIPDTNTL